MDAVSNGRLMEEFIAESVASDYDAPRNIPTQPTRRNRKEKNMISGLLSPMHLIVILVIVLIVFGPGKLPELGESLGKSIKSFKKSMEEPEGKEDSKKETKQIDDGK